MEKQYPIIDGHRRHYARVPKLVNKEVLKQLPHINYLKEGQFIAVNVLASGYSHLFAPNAFESYELCKKSCDVHNRYHRFTEDEVNNILHKSFEGSRKKRRMKGGDS